MIDARHLALCHDTAALLDHDGAYRRRRACARVCVCVHVRARASVFDRQADAGGPPPNNIECGHNTNIVI